MTYKEGFRVGNLVPNTGDKSLRHLYSIAYIAPKEGSKPQGL
jgi:hypothetical protein